MSAGGPHTLGAYVHLTWEGRSAHRSSRSAALRPTRPPRCACHAERERVGAAAELRGGKAGLSALSPHGSNTFAINYKQGGTHPNLRNPPDPLSRWAWARVLPFCFRWDVEPPPAACLCMSSLQRRVGWSRRSMAARKPGGGVALSLLPPSTCPCFAHSRPSVHASSRPWWDLITQCAAPSSPQGVNSPSTGTPSGVRYMSTR